VSDRQGGGYGHVPIVLRDLGVVYDLGDGSEPCCRLITSTEAPELTEEPAWVKAKDLPESSP